MSVAPGGGGSSGGKTNASSSNSGGSNSTFNAARGPSSSGSGSGSSVPSTSSSRRPLPSIYVPSHPSHSSFSKPSPFNRSPTPSAAPSPSLLNSLRAFLAPFYRLSSARAHVKLTRSNIAEQLREYQRRRQHDWASAAFYAATAPSAPASAAARRRRCALAVLLVILACAVCASVYLSVQVWHGMRYGWSTHGTADSAGETVYERRGGDDRGGRVEGGGERIGGGGEGGERGGGRELETGGTGGEVGDKDDGDGENVKGRLKNGPESIGDGRTLVMVQALLLLVTVLGVVAVAACSRHRWRKGRRRRSGSNSRLLPS
ncbi:hypothetical protein CLOM_g2025 [Closterium sp. NIES-68]|nr:hypothetical protein CLOM_g2025 [Closterium sp. NIES-68]GJP67481.1 hypothetical protein CLOP_g24300 [Closterium sp. NIES-67]